MPFEFNLQRYTTGGLADGYAGRRRAKEVLGGREAEGIRFVERDQLHYEDNMAASTAGAYHVLTLVHSLYNSSTHLWYSLFTTTAATTLIAASKPLKPRE